MTRTRSFRWPSGGRTFAAAALTGPLITMFLLQSWPVMARPASEPTPSSAPRQGANTVQPRATPLATAAGRAAGASSPTPVSSPSGPQLSIGVDDGKKAVRTGDVLTYTVKIHNIGAKSARGLDIVQTLPAGLNLISATRHGAVRGTQVTWKADLPAGGTGAFDVVGKVGQTPRQLLRLATVACATSGNSARPIVCAAHSDELPAGAAARMRRGGSAATGGAAGYLLPVGVALVVCAVAVLGARRLGFTRWRRRAS
jgi:uncharacterized repeat protein (TIGR01451 family)